MNHVWSVVWRWLKKKDPRLEWHLRAGGAALAVAVAWAITGTFFRALAAVLLAVGLWYGLRLVGWVAFRIRATTEAGIPLSLVRMVKDLAAERAKFADADERWEKFTSAQKIAWNGMSPKLHRKQQTATGDVRASINPAGLGGDLDAITRLAATGTLAGVMKCEEVSVQPTSHNKAWITFYKTPPLNRAFTLADLPPSGRGRVSFAVAEVGGSAAITYGKSALVVSVSGGGKSVLFKNWFADLLRDDVPTEMFIVDPKRMELAAFKPLVGHRIGNILIAGYCNTAAEAEVMFRDFTAEMHARQQRLADMGLVELQRPTVDFPGRVIVADEMADIKATFAKLDLDLPIMVSQGRATLDFLFGLAQVAKIETLGTIRDLVGIRIGLRMMTAENTKAALAISDEYAPCSRIPMSTPGVGYYVTDDGTVGKFRTTKVTDKQWADLLTGKLPEGMAVNVENVGPPCFVYDAPLRKSNHRGYVGIAGADGTRHPVATRRAQHRRYDRAWCHEHQRVENWWRVHIDDKRMNVYKFPSRAAAKIAEEKLIRDPESVNFTNTQVKFTGRPVWNIQHNTDNPDSNANLAKRAGAGRRLRDAAGEYRELRRDVWAVRQVKAAFRHQERVQRQVEKRDQFVATVTGELQNAGDLR